MSADGSFLPADAGAEPATEDAIPVNPGDASDGVLRQPPLEIIDTIPACEHQPSRPRPLHVSVSRSVKKRIKAVLAGKLLLTAFQPISELPIGNVIGVEALTRFVTSDGASADVWFREAAAVGLETELEIAALHCALTAAKELPGHLFVAFNLTPTTCCDPRISQMLLQSHLIPGRIVIELTGSLEASEHLPLTDVLTPLRQRGVRLAVSAPGAGSVSLGRTTQLRPDIIQLQRPLIKGIQDSPEQLTHAEGVIDLAHQTGATVWAEGIETPAEFTAVKALGVKTGQGYLLGRPSVRPIGWST
ncbi:MAG: EAL domain-containing protein, partial [Actinomycetes bacterium]